MTRRLDAVRFDAARPVTGRKLAEAEALRAPSFDRQRLDSTRRAANRARHTDANSPAQDADASSLQAPASSGQSLDDVLLDLVTPRIDDPSLLRRSVSILEHCVDNVLPTLEGGDQLRHLAATLIEDEIQRHRTLLERMQGGER